VVVRKDPKNLVRKRPADHSYACEIEYDISEAFDSMHDPFGLGPGNQLIALVERQTDRYDGSGEAVGFLIGEFAEYRRQGSARIQGQLENSLVGFINERNRSDQAYSSKRGLK